MGQCPMMPEPAFGCSQRDEKSGIIRSGALTCAGGNQKDDESFLVPHRPDLAMRSIVDPTHVYEIIMFQAEILTRRAELVYKEGLGRENSNMGDTASEDYEPSTFAPSTFTQGTELTSYSVATRVAGNYDKYSNPKRRYNKPNAKTRDLLPRKSISNDRVMEAINDGVNASSRKREPSQKGQQETSIACGDGRAAQVLKSNPALRLVAPCVGLQPVVKTQFSREEFYNVLQLKMKLHLTKYYQNHYLAMFPESPMPAGLIGKSFPDKQNSPPELSPSSSDSSSRESATRDVAFGSGIASSSIRLSANDSSFLDLAITGSLGLIDRGTGNSVSHFPSQQKIPSHYLVLINRRSGVPLAVCALKSHHGPPVVRIFATKSRVVGQRPAASTEDLGLTWTASYPLFAWAEFTTEGEFPMPARYSLYMASGSEGRFEKEPSYRASHMRTGSPDISMVGRTQTETDYSGCALFSVASDESNGNGEPFLSLSISRGIDPALMICFAAIVDETVEKTMRLHCELNTRKEMRRSRSSSTTPVRSVWD